MQYTMTQTLNSTGGDPLTFSPESAKQESYKFQFSDKIVDFTGFRVSISNIEPLLKYINAIREFTTPVSTTDVCSWFGLVNHVTNYAQLRDIMAPFKRFLSHRHTLILHL